MANPALPADTGFDQRHRGVATWLAPSALGVDQAAVWGALPLALNFIPQIGSIVITGASALAGFVQFGSFDMALVLAGTSIALHTVSGNLLTPWLTVRISRIIPVIVFVGVLLFGCWAIARLHNPRGLTIPPLCASRARWLCWGISSTTNRPRGIACASSVVLSRMAPTTFPPGRSTSSCPTHQAASPTL